jgi:hypothetical protein
LLTDPLIIPAWKPELFAPKDILDDIMERFAASCGEVVEAVPRS